MSQVMRSAEFAVGSELGWHAVVHACLASMAFEEVDPHARRIRGHTLPNGVSKLRLAVEVSVVGDDTSVTVRATIDETPHRRFARTVTVWWEAVVSSIERELDPPPPVIEPEPAPLRFWFVEGVGAVVGAGLVVLGADGLAHGASLVMGVVAGLGAILGAESVWALVSGRGRRPPWADAPSEEAET